MRKRKWSVVLGVIAVAALYVAYKIDQQPPGQPAFADLDRTLESHRRSGWTVAVEPKRPGPYRLVPGETAVTRDPAAGVARRITDRDGTPEEIKLEGSAEVEQAVLTLETRDGHITLVGLKRPRAGK